MSAEEKSPSDQIHDILKVISEQLGVDVVMADSEGDNKVMPYYDVNSMLSKLLALMVFIGVVVPSQGPPYNRVHADVEWWKNRLKERKEVTPEGAG